ncbi:MAG TPA: DUF4339 domain-containing protein [Thermoanaerobaculia bacterium]|nr:DUF4339 domain-containing protein [Thermoanaerobaculia bacterium]
MEPLWFYLDGEQRQGPMTLEQLLVALRAAANPHAVLVWNEGLAGWTEARSVPEIGAQLPPSMFQVPPPISANRLAPLEDAETMARLYRRLVLLVGMQIVLEVFRLTTNTAFSSQAAASIFFLLWIALLLATAVTAYQLTRQLREGVPLLWAIAMFLPCIGILVLLMLSSKAQAWCQRYGIKVGLLGPTRESLEEFRQRLLSSHFD